MAWRSSTSSPACSSAPVQGPSCQLSTSLCAAVCGKAGKRQRDTLWLWAGKYRILCLHHRDDILASQESVHGCVSRSSLEASRHPRPKVRSRVLRIQVSLHAAEGAVVVFGVVSSPPQIAVCCHIPCSFLLPAPPRPFPLLSPRPSQSCPFLPSAHVLGFRFAFFPVLLLRVLPFPALAREPPKLSEIASPVCQW